MYNSMQARIFLFLAFKAHLPHGKQNQNKFIKERKHLGSWDIGQSVLLSKLTCNLYLIDLHFKVFNFLFF